MTRNITAIILAREDFREADLRVTLFSKECGRLEAIAVGAKKIVSKLAGHLEPWRLARVMIVNGKQWDKIGQAVTAENFLKSGITDLVARQRASRVAKMLVRLLPEKQPEIAIYNLAKDFFQRNFVAGVNPAIEIFFTWRLVNLLGHQPDLKKCLVCGQSIQPEKNYFDSGRGGLVCNNCAERNASQLPVTKDLIKVLRFITENNLEKTLALKITPELENILQKIIEQFLIYQF